MKENEIQTELASIRNLMERSSKFISLSGLSGILAGVYALIGAAIAEWLILNNPVTRWEYGADRMPRRLSLIEILANTINSLITFIVIALVVLSASIITGFILSNRKAKRNGQLIWTKTSRTLLFYFGVPLMSGAAFILIFLDQGLIVFVIPAMLIFYGLALVSASSYTFSDVKYLGLCEIALGLVAACLSGYGLLFWAIGFGVLHIVYGSLMYFKYDR